MPLLAHLWFAMILEWGFAEELLSGDIGAYESPGARWVDP
jgi:hypothetical protein